MSITDLLGRVSFSPAHQGDGAPSLAETSADGHVPTVEIELPPVEETGGPDPVVLPSFAPVVEVIRADPEARPEPETAPFSEVDAEAAAPDDTGSDIFSGSPSDVSASDPNAKADLTPVVGIAPTPPSSLVQRARALPPLPSWSIVVIGALSLLSLSMAAALAVAIAEPSTTEAVPATTDTSSVSPPEADSPTEAASPEAPLAPPASFTAEPTAIPVELLTRLEQASDEALDVELARLLEAMQFGFGRRSALLEPTLRSYVYRMGSRFEWNPDTFRVAVTAPDPALATARAALLERLFEDAVAAGRLDVGTGIGPHALTLVTE